MFHSDDTQLNHEVRCCDHFPSMNYFFFILFEQRGRKSIPEINGGNHVQHYENILFVLVSWTNSLENIIQKFKIKYRGALNYISTHFNSFS